MDSVVFKSLDDWKETHQKVRENFFTQVNNNYQALDHEFFELSEFHAHRYLEFSNKYKIWRTILIWALGGMAIINLIIASDIEIISSSFKLEIAAAIYAALLTIFGNIENFLNYSENKQTSRNARELYLDSHRHFEMLWNIHVRPFCELAEGCLNASILYRQIVKKDEELRSTVKEMTKKRKDK